MKRRLLATILSCIMITAYAGCGTAGVNERADSSQNEEGGFIPSEEVLNSSEVVISQEQDSEAEGGFDVSGIDTSEHVVITYLTIGDKPEGKAADRLRETMAELNEKLNDELNAELNIEFIEWDNYLSDYNKKLALKDGSVDLVGASTDWLEGWSNAKKGVFLPLSIGILEKYAPKTYGSVTSEHWDMCKYDGKIYFMPEDNYTQWTNHGFIYRKDFAKEAGLREGINSWEELTTYFWYVRNNHPELKCPWDSDGTNFDDMTQGWIQSHSDYVAIDGLGSAKLWCGTKEDPYTIHVPIMEDTDMFVEYASLMKKWDSMGVWTSNVMNNAGADNRKEYREGLVAAEEHHTQTFANLCSNNEENMIYKNNPEAESDFFYFGKETGNIVTDTITHGAMAVSAGSKNPERALMVYDMLRNDKACYSLICYGIEGISYVINEEGLRAKPEGFDAENDSVYSMTNFWWGRNDDLEIRDAEINWDIVDELYTTYDKKKIEYPYGQFVPDESEFEAKKEKCNEIYEKYMKEISYGKYDGTAEGAVSRLQSELALEGIDDVTMALQEQIDALYR
ncbi:extracellular solute-binding protein [Butyrivibrio sp. JL13D10]|uniref:extracellular solute-binding protein n=1 Tax=Butyrivibrio sp. JL13D10 TaxID=3236815 RepID=UPI0038B429CF